MVFLCRKILHFSKYIFYNDGSPGVWFVIGTQNERKSNRTIYLLGKFDIQNI